MTNFTLSQLVGKPVDPVLVAAAASLLLTQSGLSAPEGYEDDFGFHFGALPTFAAPEGQPDPLLAAVEI